MSRSTWNASGPTRTRTPGTRVILVAARSQADAIARARSLPWWGRVATPRPIVCRGRWAFEVR